MGVGDLFEPTSDFSWLTGEIGSHFNDANHKAKIRVDENGEYSVTFEIGFFYFYITNLFCLIV